MLRALAALTALVILACVAPAALAAAPNGQIAGTVTDASTLKPIEGVEVCASLATASEEEEPEGAYSCAKTGADGKYTISELKGGSFNVQFGSPLASIFNSSYSPSNYVVQYYDDKPTAGEAGTVAVNEGATTEKVDAALREGATISGRITSASTGAPLEKVLACALRGSEGSFEAVACGRSGANGEYTIEGVPDGVFDIGFAGAGVFGYYPGKPTAAEASTVTIHEAKEVKSGVDAALEPRAPLPSGPTPTGPAAPGAPSTTLPGLTGPPKPVSQLAVQLTSPLLGVRRGAIVLVKLACAGAASCHGRIELTVKRSVRRHGRTLEETVRIAAPVAYSLAPRASATVTLRLGAYARALLGAAHGHLSAHLAISQTHPAPGITRVESVVLLERRVAQRQGVRPRVLIH